MQTSDAINDESAIHTSDIEELRELVILRPSQLAQVRIETARYWFEMKSGQDVATRAGALIETLPQIIVFSHRNSRRCVD